MKELTTKQEEKISGLATEFVKENAILGYRMREQDPEIALRAMFELTLRTMIVYDQSFKKSKKATKR